MGREGRGSHDIYVPKHLEKALDARKIRDQALEGKEVPEDEQVKMLIGINALMQKSNIEIMLEGMGVEGVEVHAWIYRHNGSFSTKMKTLEKYGLTETVHRLLTERKNKVKEETASFFEKG
jgi:hypothetical protein